MKSLFEENGGTYCAVGNYYIPNISISEQSEYRINAWGLRRLDYLKKNRRMLYVSLLTSGRLTEHLREIETTAFERYERITRQMVVTQCVTEQLKAKNQIEWVGIMKNIRSFAEEIILNELINN